MKREDSGKGVVGSGLWAPVGLRAVRRGAALQGLPHASMYYF